MRVKNEPDCFAWRRDMQIGFNDIKEHLQYELRFLFGAQLLIKTTKNDGNLQNYFKDSAYIHTRTLYEFFTAKSGGNDIHLEDLGQVKMQSSLYNKWLEALNRRAMHLSPGRVKRNNTKEPLDSGQLNDQIDNFCHDITSLWLQWVKNDNNRASELIDILWNAKDQAHDDYTYFLENCREK